jgi:ATP-dependent RNA helicase RhlE
MQQRTVDLSGIEILVLDEADRMLDMGFIKDIRKIISVLPKQRQNLMFSATFSPDIRELANGLLNHPVSVDVAPRNTAAETVTQRVIETNRDQKKDLLLHLFETRGWHQVLIFTRTKHGADALSRHLEKADIKSAALHGNKSQGARTRALTEFKEGKLVALVATDIAARGIDIDSLPYVINYEIPNISEDYVHRIGRTGRAGMEGEAISLVGHDERGFMRDIERLIKRDIEREIVPGFEPSAIAPPAPVQPQRGARRPSQPSKTQAPKTGQNRGGPPQHRSGSRHR